MPRQQRCSGRVRPPSATPRLRRPRSWATLSSPWLPPCTLTLSMTLRRPGRCAAPLHVMPLQAMPVSGSATLLAKDYMQAMPLQAMPLQTMPPQAMPLQTMPVLGNTTSQGLHARQISRGVPCLCKPYLCKPCLSKLCLCLALKHC